MSGQTLQMSRDCRIAKKPFRRPILCSYLQNSYKRLIGLKRFLKYASAIPHSQPNYHVQPDTPFQRKSRLSEILEQTDKLEQTEILEQAEILEQTEDIRAD